MRGDNKLLSAKIPTRPEVYHKCCLLKRAFWIIIFLPKQFGNLIPYYFLFHRTDFAIFCKFRLRGVIDNESALTPIFSLNCLNIWNMDFHIDTSEKSLRMELKILASTVQDCMYIVHARPYRHLNWPFYTLFNGMKYEYMLYMCYLIQLCSAQLLNFNLKAFYKYIIIFWRCNFHARLWSQLGFSASLLLEMWRSME